MRRVLLKDMPLERKPLAGLGERLRQGLAGLFLAAFLIAWMRLFLPGSPLADAAWPEGLLLVLAAGTLLASLSKNLPGQNVMLASAIIVVIGSAASEIGALSGIPFGPLVYTTKLGQRILPGLPWVVPMVWLTAILSSRGVARLALRPWRSVTNYGYRVLALTAVLVVWFDFALEPFASRIMHFWRWNPTRINSTWYGTPWVNFLGWILTTLLILAFVTPSLISKKPGKPPPPEYHPLMVWLLLNLLFATACALNHLWFAAVFIAAGTATAAVYAIRGARW